MQNDDNQSLLEEYSGGGSKETCSCSLYGGGGIGISDSPDIMELWNDESTMITYGPGSMNDGWKSPVRGSAIEFT